MNIFWWLAAAVFLALGAALDRPLLLVLAVVLVLVGAVGWLWGRYCLDGVSYRRTVADDRLFPGDQTELVVQIINAKPLPLAWLRIEDTMPTLLELAGAVTLPSHRPGKRRLVNLLALGWYEKVTRRYTLQAMQRGVWEMGPVELVSGDLFGFGVRRREEEAHQTLIVYPKIAPLDALGLPSRRPFGDLTTPQWLVDDPLRVTGAREYQLGDSFRHIHWKATAQRQQLHTRVFEPAASQPFAIFLNINPYNLLIEGRDQEIQEFAISIAASTARWALDQGQATGLYVNTIMQPAAERIAIKPSAHPEQLHRLLEALSRAVLFGRWSIESVLVMQLTRLPAGAICVVVTAAINEELRAVLLDAARRGYVVVLLTLGRAQWEPAPGIRHHYLGGREEWRELAKLALV